MRIRRNLHTPVSVGDELAYQEAVTNIEESATAWDKVSGAFTDREHSVEAELAEAANGAAWDSLTAFIDMYVARRIMEALPKPARNA